MTKENKPDKPTAQDSADTLIANEDLEWKLLCNMIGNFYGADDVIKFLTPEAFYFDNHRKLYDIICDLRKNGYDCDMVSISSILAKRSDIDIPPFKVGTDALIFDTHSMQLAAFELEDMRRRRAIQLLGKQLLYLSTDNSSDLDEMTDQYSKDLLKVMEGKNNMAKTLSSIAHDAYENRGKKVLGIKTGYKQIDEYGGLPLPGFNIIGAGTSQGKSAFVLNLSLYAARTGHRVAYYSLEMSDNSLATRILSNLSGVPSNDIRLNRMDLVQQSRVTNVLERMDKEVGKSIYFDYSRTTNLYRIIQSIRYMKHNYNIDMAVIDHMHILKIPEMKRNETQEQQLARAASELFDISQECQISVVSLAQFNREEDSTEPVLSRLRGSGQIAEAADMVLLLYRPEHYNASITYSAPYSNVSTHNTVMCKVAKFRDGQTCKFIMGFDPATSLFTPLDQANLPKYS